MLPRVNRLPSTVRLGRTNRLVTPFFSVTVGANNLGVSRFAVIVGKKVDKRAVTRNRVRRQFQACFLNLLPQLQIGKDILCIAREQSTEATFEQLCNELQSALKKKEVMV